MLYRNEYDDVKDVIFKGDEKYANEGIEVKGHSQFREAIEREKAAKRKMQFKHLPIYVMPQWRKNGVVEAIEWLQKKANVRPRPLSYFGKV